jgi:hypothetical protein
MGWAEHEGRNYSRTQRVGESKPAPGLERLVGSMTILDKIRQADHELG